MTCLIIFHVPCGCYDAQRYSGPLPCTWHYFMSTCAFRSCSALSLFYTGLSGDRVSEVTNTGSVILVCPEAIFISPVFPLSLPVAAISFHLCFDLLRLNAASLSFSCRFLVGVDEMLLCGIDRLEQQAADVSLYLLCVLLP